MTSQKRQTGEAANRPAARTRGTGGKQTGPHCNPRLYNDRTWLDAAGHPHTESLRTTERFHRKDFGHLEITETFDDPKAYAHPWTLRVTGDLMADSDLIEYVCNENEKGSAHLVGKASDLKSIAVEVAPEILARYVGVCAETAPRGGPLRIEIFLSGAELLFSRNGRAKEPLTPLEHQVCEIRHRSAVRIRRGKRRDCSATGPQQCRRRPVSSGSRGNVRTDSP